MKYFLCLGALISALSATGQSRGFSPFDIYPVQKRVAQLLTKDLTGDGIPDLTAFYAADDNNLGILDGKSGGKFRPERLLPKQANYSPADIADLDNDHLPDLVISSYWDNGFRIYFGNKLTDHAASVYMATGVHGRELKCVDINKDGKTDIIAVTSGSGRAISLHVFINKGDGTFFPKRTFSSTLDTAKEIYITDKNNDGLLDVVVSSSWHFLLFYIQQPDGGFVPNYWQTYTTAYPVIKDLDKDGLDDLLLLYPSFENAPNSDSIVIRRNLGGMDFSDPIRVPSFENRKIRPTRVCVEDVNKDGWPDIYVNQTDNLGESTDSAFYLLGNGPFSFDDPVRVSVPGKIFRMELTDLNNDGYVDWVVTFTNTTIGVALGNQHTGNTNDPALMLYPNPAKDRVYIDGLQAMPYSVRVYTASGSLVMETTINGPAAHVDIGFLTAGLYYIELNNKRQKITKPVVKQ